MIAIDTDDYASAGNQLIDGADLLRQGLTSLYRGLLGTEGMAGDDPIGSKFGHQYDHAVHDMFSAVSKLAATLEAMGIALIESGSNHQAATAYSCIGGVGDLGDFTTVGFVKSSGASTWSIPSAVGATSHEPPGWHLVADVVGYIWPNGSESLLQQAATYWITFGSALMTVKTQNFSQLQALITDNTSPEIPVIAEVTAKVIPLFSGLLGYCGDLQNALGTYAEDIAWSHLQMAKDAAELLADIGFTIITIGIGGGSTGAATAAIGATMTKLEFQVFGIVQTIGTILTYLGDALSTLSTILDSIQAMPVIPELTQASNVTYLAGDVAPMA